MEERCGFPSGVWDEAATEVHYNLKRCHYYPESLIAYLMLKQNCARPFMGGRTSWAPLSTPVSNAATIVSFAPLIRLRLWRHINAFLLIDWLIYLSAVLRYRGNFVTEYLVAVGLCIAWNKYSLDLYTSSLLQSCVMLLIRVDCVNYVFTTSFPCC